MRPQRKAFRCSCVSPGSSEAAKDPASRNQLLGPVAAKSRQTPGRSVAACRQALAPLALKAGSALAGAKPRAGLGGVPCPETFLQERAWIGWQITVEDARRKPKSVCHEIIS